MTKKPAKTVKLPSSTTAPKLTTHRGYLSPYLLFYGEGDPECSRIELLSVLHHVGKEHACGQGHVTIEKVVEDAGEGWRMRL